MMTAEQKRLGQAALDAMRALSEHADLPYYAGKCQKHEQLMDQSRQANAAFSATVPAEKQ